MGKVWVRPALSQRVPLREDFNFIADRGDSFSERRPTISCVTILWTSRVFSLQSISLLLLIIQMANSPARAECIDFTEAGKHIGEVHCVRGTVLRVAPGDRGVQYLEFCQNQVTCPFTVVIFADNLNDVGDVRQLTGNTIEVHGAIKEYDGRAEIILERSRQLGREGALLPPVPKAYDVENHGHYSAGRFSRPRAPRKTYKKKQPVTLPIDVSPDSPD